MYIRISISAQSAASTPPAPERMRDQRFTLVVLAREQGAHLGGFDVGAQGFLVRRRPRRAPRRPRAFFLGGHLVDHRQVVNAVPQLLDPAQFALRVGKLTGHTLGVGLVVPQFRVRRLLLELLDAAAQTVDIKYPLHRGQGGIEGGDVG